jgi:hypothetical protein
MARKKAEEINIDLPVTEEIKGFALFKEQDKLYLFHFCGTDEKSQWFRKTIEWDDSKPKCEGCNKPVPNNLEAIVKFYHSKL